MKASMIQSILNKKMVEIVDATRNMSEYHKPANFRWNRHFHVLLSDIF